MPKRSPGLYKRQGIWHIDKWIQGRRIRESTGSRSLAEAERYLSHRTQQVREQVLYGRRPRRTWREAATRYLETEQKRSLDRDATTLETLDQWIGDVPLDQVHMDTLQPFIAHRKAQGRAPGTIDRDLAVVRRILHLAARLWRDENGLTWLEQAPLIQLTGKQGRKPYPLSIDEQRRLFRELPDHLERMAQFAVQTGCRDAEVCGLRWAWETWVPELGVSVFVVPSGVALVGGRQVKAGQDRVIVPNSIARAVVEDCRGQHPTHVFTYQGQPVTRMHSSAWRKARARAGVPVRVHDLRHTFGRRLRAAGVPEDTRRVLLGHATGDVTAHYSAAELGELLQAVERLCEGGSTPTLTVLRPHKSPAGAAS